MRYDKVVCVAVLAASMGCGSDPFDPAACGSIAAEIGPATPSVAIGYPAAMIVRDPASGEAVRYCGKLLPATELQWTSADPAIASVDPSTGVLTGLSLGKTIVTVHWSRSDAPLASVEAVVYAPLTNRIIYSKRTASDIALWTMTPAGSDPRKLIGGLQWPEQATVSPDGRTVVYEDGFEIHTVDGAGRNHRQLVTGMPRNMLPSWSRDGRWILFNADGHDGLSHLFLMREDGGDMHRVPSPLVSTDGEYDAAWSPNGNEIVFRIRRGIYYDAVGMDTSGANARVLTAGLDVFAGYGPSWSPDGQSILFVDAIDGCTSELCIVRLGVTSGALDILADARGNMPPRWSPDGSEIVYGAGDLWIMSADGSDQRMVLTDGNLNWQASWAPSH